MASPVLVLASAFAVGLAAAVLLWLGFRVQFIRIRAGLKGLLLHQVAVVYVVGIMSGALYLSVRLAEYLRVPPGDWRRAFILMWLLPFGAMEVYLIWREVRRYRQTRVNDSR